MRIRSIIVAPLLGLALALAACNAADETETDAADEAAESETSEEDAGEEAAATDPAADIEYFVDESGMFDRQVGEQASSNIRERLAARHATTGNDIRVLMVASNGSGRDTNTTAKAERAEMGADALIYIDIEEESIAVVGQNIDENEGQSVASAMVTAFDAGNFENGILNGVTATEMHMED